MDRFIRLRIYDTSDTLKYDNQNDTSWGIESGSMVLDGFIMDSELKFGELTSSMFSCKVFGINEDLRGYKILVSVGTDAGIETNLLTNDGDPILTNDGDNITTVQVVDNRIFTGYISSSRTDTSELYRDIEAYDLAYDLNTKDATAFWNSFWTTNANTTVTLADIRSALLTYFSIAYVTPPTLVNDDLVITNTFEGITTVTLTFGTILASICELQNTCPHFNGSGQLEFYKLGANTYNVMSQIEKYNSEWEDYTTATITGVAIYDTSDNIVKRVGTAGNFYNISGNLFLLGRTAQELDTIGGNMLTELSLITYVPAKLKFIESQLDYRFGDKLVTDRGNTYIFSNRLSGSVLIEQTTSCNALGETLGDIPSDVNDSLVNTHSMHQMKNTVDELSSIITDPTTGLESIVQQLSDKIVLKVQSDGTLALCELSADPSSGTTAFIVKAGNFSVDAAGNVFIAGDITAKSKLTMRNAGNISGDYFNTDVMKITYEEEAPLGHPVLNLEKIEICDYQGNSHVEFRRSFSSPYGAMYVHDAIFTDKLIQVSSDAFFRGYVNKDYVESGVSYYGHPAFMALSSEALSYIEGAKGYAGFNFNKSETSSACWTPAICFNTYGDNSWQIGNYNNSNIEFVFATAANIASQTNTVQKISLVPGEGTIAHSGNVGTGDSDGQIKIAGTNVNVKNVLKLSGGTMTGDITRKYSDISISANPSANKYHTSLTEQDKNGNTIGFIGCYQNTSGTIGQRIFCTRKVGSNTIYHGIQLNITSTGARGVSVDDAGVWRSALGLALGWWNGVPKIGTDGLIEIGKYIDFHLSSSSTTDYDFRFTNNASGKLTASGTITQGSSKKIKENIKPIEEEEALKILELEPVSFDYKEKFGGDKDHRGFIAEEVDKILPNLTTPEYGDENDLKHFTPMSLTYTEMIPYLVKIAQMQNKKIKSLESRIEKLESIIEKFAIDTIINNTTGGEVNE